MKIGVLGSGEVGKTLASGFLKHHHEVAVGTRDPAKLEDWSKKHPKGRVVTFSEAVAFGEVIVLAVKGTIASEPLRYADERDLAGKIVIDAVNPIADAPPAHGVLKFFT